MSWAWKVQADYPTRIISEHGWTLTDRPRTEVKDWRSRGAWFSGVTYEPLLGGIILEPQLRSDDFQYPAEYYNVHPGTVGNEWITINDCWGEINTRWLCMRSTFANALYPTWHAYLASGTATLEADRGVYYDMYLMPPTNSVNSTGRLTNVTFWPRVDPTFYVTDPDGSKRYWAPYRAVLYGDRMTLEEVVGDPAAPPATTDSSYSDGTYYKVVYEHPIKNYTDICTDFYCKRQRIWFLPAREDQLMVKAAFLENEGFVYRKSSDVVRNGYSFFPTGVAGVSVANGGSTFMQIVPGKFATSGTYYSAPKYIPMDDSARTVSEATITVNSTTPLGESYGVIVGKSLVNATDYSALASDYVLGTYRYKLQIDTTNENSTPIIEDVTLEFDATEASKTFTPSYIEDDIISIEETESEGQGGRTVTILLRDPDETYKSWRNRYSIAFNYDWVETTLDEEDEEVETTTDRALVFLEGTSYDEDNKTIEFTCRDGWSRLEKIMLPGASKGDGKQYTDYIEELLLWAGWDPTKIDIYSTEAPTLPVSYDGEEPAWQPDPGTSLAEYIRSMHADFASQDRMTIEGDGTFKIENGNDYTPTPARTFYWSHEDANTGGDWFATIDKNSWREHRIDEDFYNLIWVVGLDREKGPLIAYYADNASATDTSVDNYTGEWRQYIYINEGLTTQEVVNQVCISLAYRLSKMRKVAEFTSHFYPDLSVGQFIQIDDSDVTYWEITSMRYNINADTLYDDDTEGEKVAKCSYGIREWVGRYAT